MVTCVAAAIGGKVPRIKAWELNVGVEPKILKPSPCGWSGFVLELYACTGPMVYTDRRVFVDVFFNLLVLFRAITWSIISS